MANLRSIFIKGVNTAFSVFSEAVKVGTYVLVVDDGFDAAVETPIPVRCIFEKFEKDDNLSFSDLIQPTDIKGLIPEEDITLAMNTKSHCIFDGVTYSVEGYELDPMSVLYTLLLRHN